MKNNLKSRSKLKREVKELYRGNWGKAIKLNLLPVILKVILRLYVLIFILSLGEGVGYGVLVGVKLGEAITSPFFISLSSFIWGMLGELIVIGILYTTLNWIRTKEAPREILPGLFGSFTKNYLVGNVAIAFIANIVVLLWSLLLVVPGIMKLYSYSQARYVLKDLVDEIPDGDLNYYTCLKKSEELMRGHRMQFFLLQLSFIGWNILDFILLGLLSIWLRPYKTGTYAAFYNDLASKENTTEEFIA